MYLCLDAVQTSEPQDLASPQLHLGMVDLIGVLRELLLVDFLLRYAVASLLQEREVLGRDGCNQLAHTHTHGHVVKNHSILPFVLGLIRLKKCHNPGYQTSTWAWKPVSLLELPLRIRATYK